jgi:hypothetical protein
MDIAGLDTYDLCAMFIEPRLNADARNVTIKSTYEKIQDLIRKELVLPELSEVKPLCDIVIFIAFRIMLYCDASHDFSSQLPEDNLRELKNELIEDIKWYRETYCHIKLLASANPLPPEYQPPSNVLKSSFSTTHVRKKEEIVSLIVSCLNPSYDNDLQNLVKDLMDYERSINPRATKPNIDYIPNDSIAKTISSIILNNIFLINQESIGETKDEVCTYASSGYSLIVKYIYNNVYGKTVGQNIDLTIDQESSPKNTHELLSEIRADRKQSLCNIDKDNMMENAITELTSSNNEKPHTIRLLQTIATFMDPGSNSFLQNRKYLSENDEIIQSKASQLNKVYTLNFNGIQIIKYIYAPIPGDTNYSVQFSQIFRNERLTPPLKSLDTSIRSIVSSIKTRKLPTYCSFYKTFGDFNQIVEFALYEKYIEQIYEGTKSPTFPLFMTGDLSCSIISSLFTQNTILEASSQDLFGGLQIYVTENEKLKYDYFLREIKPGINTQYEIDALKILLDMGGQLSKEVLEEVQSKAQSLTNTEYQSDKHLAAAQDLLTLQSSGFGKYNKKLKLTKSKKIKSKSPVLDEKIQKDIKVMGLSKYFKSSKLSINKIKEKVNKLKTLAKKFNLKLDKSVIQNLKKIKELHKQAKKFKINITKKNNKGKRVYKTINQLNTEIKKLKTKNKSKQKK